MRIIRSLEELPPHDKIIITIGVFDGLHLGHHCILKTVSQLAKQQKIPSLCITFSNHPLAVLNPQHAPPLIRSLGYKLEFLEKIGIQETCLIDFSQKFSNISHSEFLDQLASRYFELTLVQGYNFRFGKRNLGDLDYIESYAADHPNRVHLIRIEEIRKHGVTVSSSVIRVYLNEGSIKEANSLLHEPYFIEGPVLEGDRKGREIGFPTINQVPDPLPLVPHGVYKTKTQVDSQIYNSMTFVGKKAKNLTDNEPKYLVETHILDFNQNCYGKICRVFFIKKIRNYMHFNTFSELNTQLNLDKEQCITDKEDICL